MELRVPPERVPIRSDADGVIRVGGTRVTLDTVVAAFDAGATAEEIVEQYPSLILADVYSVIAYYLCHQSEVRAYLAPAAASGAGPRGKRAALRPNRRPRSSPGPPPVAAGFRV